MPCCSDKPVVRLVIGCCLWLVSDCGLCTSVVIQEYYIIISKTLIVATKSPYWAIYQNILTDCCHLNIVDILH